MRLGSTTARVQHQCTPSSEWLELNERSGSLLSFIFKRLQWSLSFSTASLPLINIPFSFFLLLRCVYVCGRRFSIKSCIYSGILGFLPHSQLCFQVLWKTSTHLQYLIHFTHTHILIFLKLSLYTHIKIWLKEPVFSLWTANWIHAGSSRGLHPKGMDVGGLGIASPSAFCMLLGSLYSQHSSTVSCLWVHGQGQRLKCFCSLLELPCTEENLKVRGRTAATQDSFSGSDRRLKLFKNFITNVKSASGKWKQNADDCQYRQLGCDRMDLAEDQSVNERLQPLS